MAVAVEVVAAPLHPQSRISSTNRTSNNSHNSGKERERLERLIVIETRAEERANCRGERKQ